MNLSIAGQMAALGGSGGGGGINPPAGQIGGSTLNPTVVGITESSGPTSLSIGAIADGEYLVRSGSSVVGSTSGVNFTSVNAALAGANASISVNSQKITNLADGTNPADAVALNQLTSGLAGKASTTHQSTHQAGQSDALSGNLDAISRVTVRKNTGADVGSRRRINFVEGANVTLTVTDDAVNEEVDVEIAASGSGSGITQLTGDVTAGPGSGSQAATIAAGAVSLAKMADLAQDQFIGRTTASTGVPQTATITAAARTVLDDTTVAAMRTTLGADAVTSAGTGLTRTTNTYSVNTSQNIATLSNLTSNGFVKTGGGTGALSVDTSTYLTGNQSITLSSDVTGSGTTAITATIAANAVTNAKMADVATATIKGRITASTGDPEDLTGTQATTLLDTFTSGLKGLAPASGGGTTNFLRADGSWAAPGGGGGGITELTGDVTAGPGSGSQAATIPNDTVTNAKAANVATATIKGRVTAGTGDPEDLTGTQATTLLDTFTSGLKGLAPASGGGTSNFLRADGSWAAPGGGGSPGGSTTQVQYNNAGAFAGAANVEIENDNLRLENISTPSTPASGGSNLYGKTLAGYSRVAYLPADATEMFLQPAWTSRMISFVRPIVGTAAPSTVGLGATATGTQTAATWAITNQHQSSQRNEYLVTAASATAVAGVRAGTINCWIGSAAGLGGFLFNARWGPATGVATTTSRAFFGLRAATGAPTDVQPSSLVSMIGMGYDAADTNIQMMHNDSSGTATKIDLGSSFAVPTADRTAVYDITISCLPNASSVDYIVTDVSSGATASGNISTNLPANTAGLGYLGYCSVGGTSSVIGLALMRVYLETFT